MNTTIRLIEIIRILLSKQTTDRIKLEYIESLTDSLKVAGSDNEVLIVLDEFEETFNGL